MKRRFLMLLSIIVVATPGCISTINKLLPTYRNGFVFTSCAHARNRIERAHEAALSARRDLTDDEYRLIEAAQSYLEKHCE